MFKLKRPCNNCPWSKGKGSKFLIPQDRLEEFVNADAFQCHKTIDYGAGLKGKKVFDRPIDENTVDPDAGPGDKPQQCAGYMAVLERSGRRNAIMELGVMAANSTGMFVDGDVPEDFCYRPDELDPDNEAYDDLDQAIRAHTEGIEP